MIKKTAAALLAACILLLSGCAVSSEVYMSSGKYEITESMYKYWLAYYKTSFYSSFVSYGIFDGEYDESAWDRKPDGENTFGEQVSAYVENLVKEMIVCAKLYDELGLANDKTVSDTLKKTVDRFVEDDIKAIGSRPELNAALATLGMNIKTLRRVFEYEAKALIVADRLFGEGGEYAVTDAEKEAYYTENYHRVKHIMINNSFKYVTDDNGQPVMNIYTGRYEREDLTPEEKAEKTALAEKILAEAEGGADFDELSELYNEDDGMKNYEKGYFFKADDLIDTKYLAAALTLGEGDVALADTSYGLMIIKKYPLIEGIWRDETYSVFFEDLETNVTEEKKKEILGKRYGEIEKKGGVDFSSVPLLDTRLISSGNQQ